ncbi:phenylacetate-CoA ligase [Methylomagnum ishizawai]|uniref:Phenylacetate-CoA ligase n=1 Tax=Methylomagnum ishizawai TaxID=1760988 RepID=A0A1Y6CZ18_9GAMM|nr:phenylacetate--CoA ligase family protein [Methylomagnum ishizawai]SMF93562.1 phenylacetate-CoA ligase [Methylomagnum ishizawai]
MPNPFLDTSLDDRLAQHAALDGQTALIDWFRATAATVPAYRHFLAGHGLAPENVATYEDFARLPLTDKPNYMHAYPLPERCRGGSLLDCDRVAVSSGSTGQPTFWPRSVRHEFDIALRFEQVFRDSFQAHERSTLAVVCFALGNWVGGLYTASCLWHLGQKGYPLLVATPGNNKAEIFRVVRELAPHFEQTVLLGYPPFVKDVIDAGLAEGIDWPQHRIKLVFAGEVFSEEWRSLVGQRTGSTAMCYDSASLYGTADGGVLGNETPLSIAIRRFLAQHPQAARELFGESRLPTLVQYDPLSRYFELHEGTLVVSGDNGLPLFRYHIADKGGLVGHAELLAFLADHGAKLADYGLDPARPTRALPFAYVFGRADFTVSYYGANIYPENIAVGLEQPDIQAFATGKFVLEVRETPAGDSELRVAVELLPGIAADMGKAARLAESIRAQLLRLNSEFANYTPPERQTPRMELRPFGDAEYFPVGVKHRYTRR